MQKIFNQQQRTGKASRARAAVRVLRKKGYTWDGSQWLKPWAPEILTLDVRECDLDKLKNSLAKEPCANLRLMPYQEKYASAQAVAAKPSFLEVQPMPCQVLAITTAYEQGVGKGHDAHQRGAEIANPYCTSNYQSFEAWQLGYEEGKKQAVRKAEVQAEPVAGTVSKALLDDMHALAKRWEDECAGLTNEWHGGMAAAAKELRASLSAKLYTAPQAQPAFQQRVQPWMMACFGAEIAADRIERNHRFLEEALELVQSCGCTANEAHQLVDYVYGRPVGEPAQEAGGVMVTLAALCLANGLDMHACGEAELARIWTKVDAIRAKQAAKPKHSPLPQAQPADALDAQAAITNCLEAGETMRALKRVVNLLLESRKNLGPEDHELRERIDQLLRPRAAMAEAQEGTQQREGQPNA